MKPPDPWKHRRLKKFKKKKGRHRPGLEHTDSDSDVQSSRESVDMAGVVEGQADFVQPTEVRGPLSVVSKPGVSEEIQPGLSGDADLHQGESHVSLHDKTFVDQELYFYDMLTQGQRVHYDDSVVDSMDNTGFDVFAATKVCRDMQAQSVGQEQMIVEIQAGGIAGGFEGPEKISELSEFAGSTGNLGQKKADFVQNMKEATFSSEAGAGPSGGFQKPSGDQTSSPDDGDGGAGKKGGEKSANANTDGNVFQGTGARPKADVNAISKVQKKSGGSGGGGGGAQAGVVQDSGSAPQGAASLPSLHQEFMGNIVSKQSDSVVDSIIERSCLVSMDLAKGQYTLQKFIDALEGRNIEARHLDAAFPVMDGTKWQLVFTNAQWAQHCAAANNLLVTFGKEKVRCGVSLYKEKPSKVRVHWVPFHVPNDVVVAVMANFGQVKSIHTERRREVPKIATGGRVVTLIPDGDDIDIIPDFVTFTFRKEKIKMMVTAMGLPMRCHKCHLRGHKMKECEKTDPCRYCQSTEHTSVECSIQNAKGKAAAKDQSKQVDVVPPASVAPHSPALSTPNPVGKQHFPNLPRKDPVKGKTPLKVIDPVVGRGRSDSEQGKSQSEPGSPKVRKFRKLSGEGKESRGEGGATGEFSDGNSSVVDPKARVPPDK